MSPKINFDASIGDFVAEYPQSRDIFKDFELDYCCGGKKNIEIAAKEKNIDLEELKSLLQKIIDETPEKERNKSWTNESLTNIIDHIEKNHHSFAWKKLSSIEILLNKLIQVHGDKHGDFLFRLENIFVKFKEKLEKHLKTEEDIVFSYVRKLDESLALNSSIPAKDPNFTKETIEILQKEHEEAGEILSQIKSFTSNYELPDYACASFAKLYEDLEALEDDLHVHIHLENTVLFPRLEKFID